MNAITIKNYQLNGDTLKGKSIKKVLKMKEFSNIPEDVLQEAWELANPDKVKADAKPKSEEPTEAED